jgi:hypothetical protein
MTHKNYIWAILIILVLAFGVVLLSPQKETSLEEEEEIFCTMEVRQCSDGSFVGREAPSCEFAACPAGTTLLDADAEILPE